MGFSINQKNSRKRQVVSDINITPFVDVLLVLLIIFMVAAPMMTSSVQLELPQGDSKGEGEKTPPITISVKADGKVFLQDEEIKLSFVSEKLIKLTGNNLSNKIMVRADKRLDYGRVMDVVKTISQAGFSQIALVTEVAQ